MNHPVRGRTTSSSDNSTLVPDNFNWNRNLRMLSISVTFVSLVLFIR